MWICKLVNLIYALTCEFVVCHDIYIYILHVLVMIYGLSGYFKREKTDCFWLLCRVPWAWHTVKCAQFAVCRGPWAHGEGERFAVCLPCDTRRSPGWGPRWQHTSPCARSRGTRQRIVSSPCAMGLAHGKVTRNNLFFCFFAFKVPTQTIYH